MPAQRLASVSATIGQNITAYFNGTDEAYIVSANICNIGNQACGIRLALTDDVPTPDIPADAWLEYDTELMGHGVLEREGIVVGPGQRLVFQSNTSLASLNVYGIPIGGVATGAAPLVSNGDFSVPLDGTWVYNGSAVIVNGALVLTGAADVTQDMTGIATGLTYFYSFEVLASGTAGGSMVISSGPTTELINFTSTGLYSGNFVAGANAASITFNTTTESVTIDNVLIKRV